VEAWSPTNEYSQEVPSIAGYIAVHTTVTCAFNGGCEKNALSSHYMQLINASETRHTRTQSLANIVG